MDIAVHYILKAKRALGIFLAAVGIVVICISQVMVINNSELDQYEWTVNLLLNLGSGIVLAGAVILVVEENIQRLQSVIDDKQEQQRLIEDIGSRVNSIAVQAAERLRRKIWWKDGTLNKVNLTNVNLQTANLSEANLANVLLNWADLREVDFTNADLHGADFSGSQFQKIEKNSQRAATFWHANLEGAILGSANLTGVNFGGANLKGADFTNAILLDVTFNSETQFDEKTILPNTQFWSKDADLTEFTKRKPLTVSVKRYA